MSDAPERCSSPSLTVVGAPALPASLWLLKGSIYVHEVLIPECDYESVAADSVDSDGTRWKIAYVGQTLDFLRRSEQYTKHRSGVSRVTDAQVIYAGQMRIRLIVTIPVDAVGHEGGVKQWVQQVLEPLETALMLKFNTIKRELRKMRDLLAYKNRITQFTNPDICLPGEPRVYQFNCKQSSTREKRIAAMGAWFEETLRTNQTAGGMTDEEAEEVTMELDRRFALIVSARGNEPNTGEFSAEELGTTLVSYNRNKASAMQQDGQEEEVPAIVLCYDTVYMKALQKLEDYQELNPWETVDRNHVQKDINEINNEALGGHDKAVRSYLFALLKAHSVDQNTSSGVPMDARDATCIFEQAAGWLAKKEEGELQAKDAEVPAAENTLYRKVCGENGLKAWMASNHGRTPCHTPTQDARSLHEKNEERQQSITLKNWLALKDTANMNQVLAMLHSFPAFLRRVRGHQPRDVTHAERANAFLRAGYGVSSIKHVIPGMSPMPHNCEVCKRQWPEVSFVKGWLAGGNGAKTETLLQGLPEGQRAQLLAIHESHKEQAHTASVESSRRRTQNLHEAGVLQVQKRHRTREEGSGETASFQASDAQSSAGSSTQA